jgi:2Fe-2S ferredoxin
MPLTMAERRREPSSAERGVRRPGAPSSSTTGSPEGTGTWTVRIEPLGVDVMLRAGQTVMEAAQAAGFRWPTVCRGQGDCLVCRMEILNGPAEDPPLTRREREALETGRLGRFGGPPVRLACQLCPVSDMTVRKAGVRAVGG